MTAITDTASTKSTTTAAASSSTNLLADYNLFLKLLTTQMTNQDPLDPMDTSEYTAQLVQYSQVEQSIQQTGALGNILSQMLSQQMAQASSYIGREARFDSPVAGLATDSPARWTYYVDGTPATLTATVKDALGGTVATVSLDPDAQGSYEWDGTMKDGTKAPAGAYTLSIAAADASGSSLDTTINSIGTVDDVVTDGTDIMLGVNGIRLSAAGLVALAQTQN